MSWTDEESKVITKLFTEIASVKATFVERGKWNDGFRTEMIGTLAEIKSNIEQLPCKANAASIEGTDRRISMLLKFVIAAFFGVGGLASLMFLIHVIHIGG